MPDTTYFYHSFPRPRAGECPQALLDRGLHILRTMRRSGLILAPEVVEWNTPVRLGSPSPYRLLQQRVCFTELRPDELAAHSRHFGPYAIEFDITGLRRAGAMPVMYMPQALSEDDLLALLGSYVVSHLRNIKHLVESLDNLRRATDPNHIKDLHPEAKSFAHDCVFTLTNGDERRGVVQQFKVPMTSVRDLLSFLGFENAPFPSMLGALSVVESLFYPTDNEHVDEPILAYYKQREWRITANYSVNGRPRGAPLPHSEQERLLQADNQFWAREVDFDGEKFRRVDKAVSLALPPPEDITSAITRILTPAETLTEAKQLFPGVTVETHP